MSAPVLRPMGAGLELYGLRRDGTEFPIETQRLVGDDPQMRVPYVSGSTADAIVHHGGHDSNFAFLSKPFSLPALARKILSILDAEQPQPTQAASLTQGACK